VADCVSCEAGSFSLAGSSSCTGCDAGKSSSTTGATSSSVCSSCEGGTFSEVSLDKDKKHVYEPKLN